MSNDIIHVTDASFSDEVLNAKIPVLVDFWAAWCGPCKMIAPILDELSVEYKGKIKICKVDVDENTDIMKKFDIRGIPTLKIFKNGEAAANTVGARSKQELQKFIDDSIKESN
ncbi:MAG: thioredoxin 1 [Cellvibrionaceae bacterium]|jgi:thioredoxin 1